MENEHLFRLFAHFSLLFYVAALIVMLIYLRKHIRSTLHRGVYGLLCFWLILVSKDFAYCFGDVWYNDEITNVLMSIDLWPAPIIIALILRVVAPQWLTIGRMCAISIPFFVFTILCIVFKGDDLVFFINQVYGFIVISIFGVVTFRFSYKYEEYIMANYSNSDNNIDVKWVRALIISLYIMCAIWVGISINPSWLTDAIYYIAYLIFAVALFYFTFKEKSVITIDDSDESDDASQITSWDDVIEQRLLDAIHKDKLFLNPHLSLLELASYIGTNRTYLSRYINQYKSTPFVTYINNFRLEEAQRLLSQGDEQLSVADISERCGFSSVSTFRRVFKQRYGYAPSLYSRSLYCK